MSLPQVDHANQPGTRIPHLRVLPIVVRAVEGRCDECGVDLNGRHRATCRLCGAELCTDCDAHLAWDVRLDPAGETLCGWCSISPFDEAA